MDLVNQISFNESAAPGDVIGFLNLDEEKATNVRERLSRIEEAKETPDRAIKAILTEYEQDPAKMVYALFLLGTDSNGTAVNLGRLLAAMQG
jgi:hypothetical protein